MATITKPKVQMRISLTGHEPVIWRRVLVPGSAHLDRLHMIFQVVMGWTNSHLHAFEIGDARYRPGTARSSSRRPTRTARC